MKQRVFQIEVDDKPIIYEADSGLQFRVQFDVTVDALGNITLCDLNISNLSQSTANKVFKKGAVLGLRAGYNDNSDYIFRGIIRNVFRSRDEATTGLQVLARGGELRKKMINVSLGKNTTISTALRTIADTMGYRVIFKSEQFNKKLTSGLSITDDPERVLDSLAYDYDFHWTIEQNALNIFTVEGGRSDVVRTINIRSGLEGVPEVTEVGADFSVRMNPSIKIGEKIELDTKYKSFNFSGVYYPSQIQNGAGDGQYTIMKIVHSGDNYGQAWSTRCTGYKIGYQEID